MKFYYHGKDKNRKRLAGDQLFAELCDFLLANPDAILRSLKKIFPQKGFDRLLDTAVDQRLITREERRYRLAFDYYTAADLEIPQKQLRVSEQVQGVAEESFSFLYQLVTAEEDETFLGLADDFPLVESFAAGNEALQILSVMQQGTPKLDLAAYFRKGDREEVPQFRPLTELIGDVDEEYFFDQGELIIQRILKGRTPRESIFLQALVISSVLEEFEEGSYRLKILQLTASPSKTDPESTFLLRQSLAQQLLPKLQGSTSAFFLKK